jgi:trehalose-6-phosphate synthase
MTCHHEQTSISMSCCNCMISGNTTTPRQGREMVAGFCKQQLWPLFHYLIPLSPSSSGRFDPVLWQAYVKANKVRCQPSLKECNTAQQKSQSH